MQYTIFMFLCFFKAVEGDVFLYLFFRVKPTCYNFTKLIYDYFVLASPSICIAVAIAHIVFLVLPILFCISSYNSFRMSQYSSCSLLLTEQ